MAEINIFRCHKMDLINGCNNWGKLSRSHIALIFVWVLLAGSVTLTMVAFVTDPILFIPGGSGVIVTGGVAAGIINTKMNYQSEEMNGLTRLIVCIPLFVFFLSVLSGVAGPVKEAGVQYLLWLGTILFGILTFSAGIMIFWCIFDKDTNYEFLHQYKNETEQSEPTQKGCMHNVITDPRSEENRCSNATLTQSPSIELTEHTAVDDQPTSATKVRPRIARKGSFKIRKGAVQILEDANKNGLDSHVPAYDWASDNQSRGSLTSTCTSPTIDKLLEQAKENAGLNALSFRKDKPSDI